MEPTSSLNRGERKKGSSLVTGSEVQSQASGASCFITVSYTHLRAHETDSYLVCRLLLEKKKKNK